MYYGNPITIKGVLYETQWSHDRRIQREARQLERAKVVSRSRASAPGRRARLIQRANGACQVCGFRLAPVLNLHHIYPVKLSGSASDRNLAVICPNCHAAVHFVSKSTHPTAIKQRVDRLIAAGYNEQQAALIQLIASRDAHVLPDGKIEPYTDPDPRPFVIVDAPGTDPAVLKRFEDEIAKRRQRALANSHIQRYRQSVALQPISNNVGD